MYEPDRTGKACADSMDLAEMEVECTVQYLASMVCWGPWKTTRDAHSQRPDWLATNSAAGEACIEAGWT